MAETESKRVIANPAPAWARPWLFGLGVALLILTPVIGVLPGPGGVFVFAAGMALVLKNSLWARRVYVRMKKRWPKIGDWCDWGMRRPSYRRRQALATGRDVDV